MTSTCITNNLSPEQFFHISPPHSSEKMHHQNNSIPSPVNLSDLDLPEESDPELSDVIDVDFEFRLDEPVNILPADQLFSDGKLFPMHFPVASSTSCVSVSETPEVNRIINGVSAVDSILHSFDKAPKCSSSGKWKELLGLRKLYQNSVTTSFSSSSSSSYSNGNGNTTIRSIKHFLYRSSKPSTDSSVNLPLLHDTDNKPAPVPSRRSLSSSSSGHYPDENPCFSLDSDKLLKNTNTNSNPNASNPPRMRLVKTRTLSIDGSIREVLTESPRMNSSGKIVFHRLERSSSSPSSFNGGPRLKNRGMERSYSGNVRITPVLNVSVSSLTGFSLFSSSQKHEGSSNSNSNGNSYNGSVNRGASRSQQTNNKSQMDRF